jgi:hypothetical protein
MTFLLVVSMACNDTVRLTRRPSDAGTDAGPILDAGVDAGPDDAGLPDAGPPDAGPPDAGVPDAGWSGVWEPVGPPLGHEAQAYPALALDPAGAPLVAYVELVESPGAVATELHVARWSGSAWEPLGDTVASSEARLPPGAPLFVRLATDGSGRPVLAFGDSGPGATIGVFPLKTWVFDGTSWQPLPLPISAPQLSGIALARGLDGQVRFALSTGHELRVLALGIAGWTEVVDPLVQDAGVSEPDLALASDGAPLVAFSRAPSPGSFGTLRAFRWRDAGWSDLALPSPEAEGLLFHTPRIRERSDGGLVVAASEWQYDSFTKLQVGVALPVFSLGDGGWSLLEDEGQPGGFGLTDPIPGSPVGLQLSNDVPVLVSTGADGGVSLRVLMGPGAVAVAPVLGGLAAGSLLVLPDGSPLVGAVMPVSSEIPAEQADGGQVQILHFTGIPAAAARSGVRHPR